MAEQKISFKENVMPFVRRNRHGRIREILLKDAIEISVNRTIN